MFDRIKGFIRKVGIKMGIVQQLETLNDDNRVNLPREFYDKIDLWRNLHRGYDKSIHDVSSFNVRDGQCKRRLATLNTPKVLSRDLASIIFNERCDISVSTDSDTFDDYIKGVFKKNKFNSQFQQQLEFMFAQGGMVAKPYLENGQVKIGYATADSFMPISWEGANIKEGVFTYQSCKGSKFYTLLEWHNVIDGVYTVTNELYVSDAPCTLGIKTNLSEAYPGLEGRIGFPTITKPLFVYFKPNEANNIDANLPLGVSIYGNSIDTLKSIDIAFDSLQREFRLGRKRVIVPRSALRVVADPLTGRTHTYFDETDEAYESPMGNITNDNEQITFVDPQLRVNDHVGAINALLNILALQVGLSPGALSFDAAGGLKTATEVVSENSKTFRTKQSHENVIEQGITDLIEAIAQLSDAANIITYPGEIEVTVSFDDAIIQDKDSEIAREILLINSNLQTRVRAIAAINGLTLEEAEERYLEVLEESQKTSADFQVTQSNIQLFGLEE